MNLVKTDDGTLITDFDDTIDLAIGYVLVDCIDGICKQTQGYVKDSEKVIAFVGENNGINADDDNNKVQFYSSNNIANCDNKNKIGYIKNGKGSICLNGIAEEVTFSDDNKRFLILYENDIPTTTPFYVENENVPVKHGERYIIVDKFNSGNLRL